MAKALVDGQIIINDRPIAPVPNSVERDYGRGETTVTPQSLGNGNIEIVTSVNVETMKSMFKFSVKPTADIVDLIDDWKLNTGLNTIRYISEDVYETYEQMSVVNTVVIPDSNDGVIELEFQGKPLPR
jgi:hypothetical protein